MKTPLLFAALACLGAFAFAQDGGDEKKVRQIQSSEIADGSVEVIGKLGKPLGTVTTILATPFEGRELDVFHLKSRVLLRVTAIDGRELDEPLVMEFFRTQSYKGKLESYLHQMKLPAGTQLRGRPTYYQVYETGRFAGAPQHEKVIWQDVGFGFETHLNLLDEKLK
ncbi:MAG: hypothetical protein R3F11_13190 [Verrucomicrobiales bacterium]